MDVGLWAEIRRLKEVEKLSQRAIARRLHCCTKTVQKALRMKEPPTQTPAKPGHSILDPYGPRIDTLIGKYPELSAVRVLEEISKGDDGYPGGVSLVRRSADGLMDRALQPAELRIVDDVIGRYTNDHVHFHALRTRRSGRRAFISVHVLVPGAWSVQEGHDLVERFEHDMRAEFDQATVFTHLEPLEDPASFEDTALDRPGGEPLEGAD